MSRKKPLVRHARSGTHARVVTTRATRRVAAVLLPVSIALLPLADLEAQRVEMTRDSTSSASAIDSSIDSVVSYALAASPVVKAAIARLEAVRHRVGPSAAWPDPMLMAGIENLPLGKQSPAISAQGLPMSSGPDPMTMRMVGVSQTIPYPGKLRLERAIAAREVDGASASLDATRRQVMRDVKSAYYELAFLDRALTVVHENQAILGTLIRTTEARYSLGQTGQQDVLKVRIDATRLAESASSQLEQRRAVLARLNALLDRPSDAPLDHAVIPASIERAAIGDSSGDIRFTSAVLGARVADSPLPPLTALQDEAIRQSPELREHEAMIAAQAARVELSRKDYLPDLGVSLQYGQRGGGLPDMVSATISVPIPIQKHRKQDEHVAEASSTLASLRGVP